MHSRPRFFRKTAPPAHLTLLLASALLLAASSVQAAAEQLRAGVAKIDITPTQPVTLAGYESRKDLSIGVHDPLSARAMAFQSGSDRLVLVSTDNLGFYSGTVEPIRQAILEESGLKPSELFLAAIHTHSAPRLVLDPAIGHSNNVAYTQSLRGKLVEVVRMALRDLAPVQIGVKSGASPVGVNRREILHDRDGNASIVLGRNTETPIDRQVQVLKLTRGGDTLFGVLFGFATHSTSLGPKNYLVSGDIHGTAEQFLEKFFGLGIVAPGFAGASGNIDPWVRVLPDFRTNNGWIPEPVLLGTMLGQEVVRVVEATRTDINDVKILSRMETLQLPANPAQTGAGGAATKPFVVSVAAVGDVAFVGWGGEVFNELGKTVKTGSPYKNTFVLTHCNGTAGYVPIRSSYTEGGYEVRSSAFAAGAGELLAEQTVRLLHQLKATDKN